MGADRAPFRTIVQVPGDGHRIEAGAFGEAIAASANLRNLLLRYVQALSVQTSYTALSNAVHPIEERLARWLLMSHDRADGNEVPLTHEFLSLMLAVRRPSVTTALHVLEGNRFITAERGLITIRDRARLEEFAGDSYGRPEAEYERLIGRPL
jgi:CRP-like cAMP-binding protein